MNMFIKCNDNRDQNIINNSNKDNNSSNSIYGDVKMMYEDMIDRIFDKQYMDAKGNINYKDIYSYVVSIVFMMFTTIMLVKIAYYCLKIIFGPVIRPIIRASRNIFKRKKKIVLVTEIKKSNSKKYYNIIIICLASIGAILVLKKTQV